MTKLVIFDLDSVLIDSKDHFDALNTAAKVGEQYVISRQEHVSIYDGLPTRPKLELLTKNKGLPVEHYDQIWQDKQEETLRVFDQEVKKNMS